jgi:hypothetical protein
MKIFFRRVEFIVSKEGGGGSEDWVDKDDRGRITGIKVPKQSIWVSIFLTWITKNKTE